MITARFMLSVTCLLSFTSLGYALTLDEALRHAYHNNPDLNQQRAALRVTDETVPAALSGYRPSLSASASAGGARSDITTYSGGRAFGNTAPRSVGITASQPLFDGMRAQNNVASAEQNVNLGREDLRNKEQTVFLSVITAYMNVIRDQATLNLRKQAVSVAERDVTMIKERFRLGDASRTDVGLVEAQLGLSKLNMATATNALSVSRATFLQHVGKAPTNLKSPTNHRNHLPKSHDAARTIAINNNPVVKAAQFGADAAKYQVYVAQSALYPQLSLNAGITTGNELSSGAAKSTSSSVTANLVVPIFATGGSAHTAVRSAKETLGQRQIQIDLARETVRQALGASWGLYEASAAALSASAAEVAGREAVVRGFREEYKVGQRILQNVLVEEVNLNNARVTQVNWQRERTVAQYSILASIGKLNAASLGLRTDLYNPAGHYEAVRDAWGGTRTPDGR